MNILQVLPELNVGGVETGTLDLAKYLLRLGHKAVVVSNGGSLVKELESFGAVHYCLAVNKKSPFVILKTIGQLAAIIKKEDIDIVHARSRACGWAAFFAAKKTGRVFITTCHGYYRKHFFSCVMGWAKRVICPSNVVARHMIDSFCVPRERIRLVPRSVDLERFKFICPQEKRGRDFNVGIIGRITPIKGHLYFIKAMAKLSQEVPQLKIWIVGDSPASKEAYKEQLQILVRRLGLWQLTQFLGVQRDVPEILKNLDLLVLPSTAQEAFGRVVIEAQAVGVPVIAAKVGGVVDIIEHEKTGLLVAPADPQAIADAAVRIFKNTDFARELSIAAYDKVKQKYNVELMVENTLKVYKDALSDLKILIIKFSSLGDIILSTAALAAIRKKFGDNYKITFLTGNESKEPLLTCPYIDELIVCDLKNKDKGLLGLLRIARILIKKDFDMVIDLQNNRKSHLLSFLSLSPNRYGYANKKFSFLLNHRVKNAKQLLNPLEHQFKILEMLGIHLDNNRLELWPAEEDSGFADEFLKSEWLGRNQKIIGINISSSARWPTKIWPFENIVELSRELSRRDIRVVITGTDEDVKETQRLTSVSNNTRIINACGKTTINQLACLIKKCSVYISADSAPLHIAVCMDVPRIALFGPTDPRRHLVPSGNCILIKSDLSCSPCYMPKCKTKKCMESITVEQVLEAIEKLIL